MTRQAVRTGAIALVVMTVSLVAQTSVQTEPIYLSAGDLQLAFSGRTGVLVSARDGKTGADLIQNGDDERGGGWRLLLQMPDGRKASAEIGDAVSFESHRSRDGMALEWHGLKLSDGSTLPDAVVEALVTASPRDSSAAWRMSVHGLGIWQMSLVDCLDIRSVGSLGDHPARLFFPEAAGKVYRDPARTLTAESWVYPTQASMQFMAIYGDLAGFAITALDLAGELKAGAWKAKPAGRLTFTHIFREAVTGGGEVPYPVQLRLFHGDWQAAASGYREFADSAPWTHEAVRQASGPDDTFQTMMMPAGTVLGQKDAMGELEQRAESQMHDWGAPMTVSLGDWAQFIPHTGGRDMGPQMGWASLDASLRQIGRAGNFAAVDLDASCRQPNRSCSVMQAVNALGRAEGIVSTLQSRGVDMFTLDLWPEAQPGMDTALVRRSSFLDMAPFREALAHLKRGSRMVGAKQPAELLLPYMQFFRTRSCNADGEAPAFDFVYHGLVGMECDTQRSPVASTAEKLVMVAKAFTAGQRILTASNKDEDSEELRLFLKNSTLARRGFARPFLVQGTMLPDAEIETLPGSGQVVRSGVWRAKNGDVGIVLANVSREAAPVRVLVDLAKWGLDSGRDYTLRTVDGRGAVLLADGVHDSTDASLVVGAFEVMMVSIHENVVGGSTIERIVNAAKADEPCGIAPGEVVDITGEFRGPEEGVSSADLSRTGLYALELDQTWVTFEGVRAAILMASHGMVRAIVPWTVAGKTSAAVQVFRHGVTTDFFSARVRAACPGVYAAADGESALVKNEDERFNSTEQPAARGSRIVIYATGLGADTSQPRPGEVFRGGGQVSPVSVTIGGVAVLGSAHFSPRVFSGVYEVRTIVPDSIPPGKTGIVVSTVGDADTAQRSLVLNITVR